MRCQIYLAMQKLFLKLKNNLKPKTEIEKDHEDCERDLLRNGDDTVSGDWHRNGQKIFIAIVVAIVVVCVLLLTLSLILLLLLMVASQYTIAGASTYNADHQLLPSSFGKQVQVIGDSHHKSIEDNLIEVSPSSKSTIVMIDGPQSQTVAIGGTATLRCTFSEPVPCHWKRNGQPLSISGRYSYVSERNYTSQHSADCSIKITKLTTIDFAQWSCGYKLRDDDDGHEPIHSADVYIIQDKQLIGPS